MTVAWLRSPRLTCQSWSFPSLGVTYYPNSDHYLRELTVFPLGMSKDPERPRYSSKPAYSTNATPEMQVEYKSSENRLKPLSAHSEWYEGTRYTNGTRVSHRWEESLSARHL